MSFNSNSLFSLKFGWILLIVLNFIFGFCGIITCSLKLQNNNLKVQDNFFKLSIIFATCNLILSVLLLVAVIKNNQKYAVLCAFLSFLSIFSAIIHVEIGTTNNFAFIAVFIVVGVSSLFWFCVYTAFQVLNKNEQYIEDEVIYAI